MGLGAVVGLASVAPIAHQAGELEDAEMLGHRRLRNARLVRQHPHGLFAVAAKLLEDRPAGRIGKGPEEVVRRGPHAGIITLRL